MRYFAELDDNSVVVNVLCVNEDACQDVNGTFQEQLGVDFLCKVYKNGIFIETRDEALFRRKQAIIGGTYSAEHDAFIVPQPYPSWTLDLSNEGDWVAPVPMPDAVGYWYEWDEDNLAWVAHEIIEEPIGEE